MLVELDGINLIMRLHHPNSSQIIVRHLQLNSICKNLDVSLSKSDEIKLIVKSSFADEWNLTQERGNPKPVLLPKI